MKCLVALLCAWALWVMYAVSSLNSLPDAPPLLIDAAASACPQFADPRGPLIERPRGKYDFRSGRRFRDGGTV